VSPRVGVAVGIDVGGTKTAIVAVDPDTGEVLGQRSLDSRAADGAHQLRDRLGAIVDHLVAELGGRVDGIGVGVPELVTPDGLVTTDVVLPGLRGDLVTDWAALGVTAVAADVRAAAIAEATFGAGRGYASFCYVSVGTGISHCLVLDGVPWAGAHGAAILLGSGVLVDRALAGGSGTQPLEDFASGPGILEQYRAAGGVAESTPDVLARCEDDPQARRVVTAAGRALGLGLAELVNLTDPQAVIVGGGLGSAPGGYWDSAVAAAVPAIWAESARDVALTQSALGPLAGAIGAALVSRRRPPTV
jgi:glucokinase